MGNVSYNGCSGDRYSIVVNGTLYDESNPMGMEQVPGPGCDTYDPINLLFAPNTPAHIDPAGPLYCGYFHHFSHCYSSGRCLVWFSQQ